MVKILGRKPDGQHVISNSYFANFKTNVPLGFAFKPVELRSPQKLLFVGYNQYRLVEVTLTHLLKTIADLPSPTLSTDSKTITIASDITIDGVAAEADDRVEISKALAATLKVAPGTWKFLDKRSLVLENPPVYTLTGVDNIGYAWRYRVDPANGDLIGLQSVIPTNQVISQNAVKLLNMVALLDGNHNTYADASNLSNNQGAQVSFDSIDVRRIVLKATSARESYDANIPSATLGFRNQNGAIGGWFTNIRTGLKANFYASTYARGQVEYWATDDTLRTLTRLELSDAGGSRGYYSIELCADGACQLWVGNETPPNGSTVIIPDYVGAAFWPAIAGGEFTMIENSTGQQWRLRRN